MSSALPPTLTALLLAATTSSAAITIPTVSVGDAGNDHDPATGLEYGSEYGDGAYKYGDVAYEYRIGTHEVTNSQYTAFLNAVASTDTHDLYNPSMGRDRKPNSLIRTHGGINQTGDSGSYTYNVKNGFENKPVNYVSFWDAARFANWLTNGQPTGSQDSGTTEDGMYNLGGVTNPDNATVTREIDFSEGENGVAVASEDEWYKAAYYDGDDDYYFYPTQSDEDPTAVAPENADGSNNANYDNAIGSVTEVGAYTNSGSHYGTFDQGGNVEEWNDEIVTPGSRGLRGGSLADSAMRLVFYFRLPVYPITERSTIGFRVTSLAPIPEPSSQGVGQGLLAGL